MLTFASFQKPLFTLVRKGLPKFVGLVCRNDFHTSMLATVVSTVVWLLAPRLLTVVRLLAMTDGNSSCLEHVFSKVQAQGHAVVVVSEGAGEELLGAGGTIDQAAQAAGAHQKLPPIGELNPNSQSTLSPRSAQLVFTHLLCMRGRLFVLRARPWWNVCVCVCVCVCVL